MDADHNKKILDEMIKQTFKDIIDEKIREGLIKVSLVEDELRKISAKMDEREED